MLSLSERVVSECDVLVVCPESLLLQHVRTPQIDRHTSIYLSLSHLHTQAANTLKNEPNIIY